ncbi:ion transporter [Salimicrobium jeotgali]|uniref:Ion transport 2 domain-containing protein n=1 Tax=Salimicrobium jeotgali TaxID=1230341 RepID=K2H8L5_9BACI|nr:potassium channel family protein [Salimicrobium jeotgali]AKG03515.1 ion transporter [Salimicrobium jeotgali]EKE32000.1 ion transport 2 domain-containing protein [Salimicrobium jeotgali]MBM7695966.1 voltage-gated potassium channel [Salimicrobium jeotgali]
MKAKTKKNWIIGYEITLVFLALASVLFIWTENPILLAINRYVWIIFFTDVLIRFIAAEKKWQYIKKNPIDIIAALPLDAIFQTARIVRLFRVLRFFAVSRKYLGTLFSIIKTNGLDLVLSVSFILVFGAAIVVKEFEPTITTYMDGVWWSVVTTTTVGYGDISPETGIGRMVAIVLMLVGIGLIGMITSSITTFFLTDGVKKDERVEFIQKQLDHFNDLSDQDVERLIAMLEEMKGKDSGASEKESELE